MKNVVHPGALERMGHQVLDHSFILLIWLKKALPRTMYEMQQR